MLNFMYFLKRNVGFYVVMSRIVANRLLSCILSVAL